MIVCSCTKNSATLSSFKNPKSKHRKNTKTCKICGGKPFEDGSKSQHGSMVRNDGLELLKSINPKLNWKRPSNGRKRAARKARTAFIVPTILFSDLKNELSEESKDMSIAESEKVGLSILRMRFSDTLQSVPLKKRRRLSPHSPSSSHNSDDSDQVTLKRKQDLLNVNLNSLLEGGGTDQNSVATDFSGISLLAAAACDSIKGHASLEVHGSLKANAELVLSPNKIAMPLPQTSEDLGARKDLPFDASSSSALHSEKSIEVQSDNSVKSLTNLSNEVKSDSSVKSFTNVLCKTSDFTSKEIKFPWDLNAAIDENTESGSENACFNGQTRFSEQYMHQTNFGETTNMHTNSSIIEGGEILDWEIKKINSLAELKAVMKHDISCFSQIEESKVSNSFSSHHTNTLAMDFKCESGDYKEAKSPINRNLNNAVPEADRGSTLITEIDMIEPKFPVNRNLNNTVTKVTKGSTLVSKLDTIEEKDEACSVPFSLKVETEKLPSRLASCDDILSESHSGMDNRHVKAVRSFFANKKSLYVDSSTHPEVKHPEVLFGKNIFEKVSECMIYVANSDMNEFTQHDNSAKCRENHNSKLEISNTKLDTIDFDNTITAIKDFPTNFRRDLPIRVNNVDYSVGSPCQIAMENHIECRNRSDLSQGNDDDQADETQKHEFLVDYDSQYEDGELREPPTRNWSGEGVEEDGKEMMNYASDGYTNTYNAASDLPSGHLHMDNVISLPSAGSMTRKVIPESYDVAKKLYSPSSYNKMRDWQLVPGTCRNSMNKLDKHQDHCYLESSPYVYDPTNRARPSFYQDIPPQTDISQRNDNSSVRRSRSSERNDFKQRIEMHRENLRPSARNNLSMQSRGRGRGDYQAISSPKYDSNNRFDSFDYHGSRNAHAAAVAKVESSGFVVTPDGTIVKSNRARSSKDSSCQNTYNKTFIGGKSPVENFRATSTDSRYTFVRYGPRIDAVNSSSSSMQHSLSRRDHTFSPPRTKRFSQSRSPSRPRNDSLSRRDRAFSPPPRKRFSQSRSPSRSRNDSVRCCWSPSLSRVNRPGDDYEDRAINYDSLPRKYASPPSTSRWNNGKKGFNDHREYKAETQGHRFDNVRSYGRGKRGSNSSSMNSRSDETFRRPWHDNETSYLRQDTRQKSPDIRRKEGPRNFNRDSPRRPREEHGHFGNRRDEDYNANLKLSTVREGNE